MSQKKPLQPVIIPRTKLGAQLDEATHLKLEALKLLRQLEENYAGRPLNEKPGGWRHNPVGWQKRHRP